jgi:GNAT superfamily N-acetyltransferase
VIDFATACVKLSQRRDAISTLLSIRFADPRDAATIEFFIRKLAEYEREPNAVEVTASQLRAQMQAADPPFECLIAEDDAKAVAIALFFRNYSTWRGKPGLYLEDLFVLEEYRGRGIGGALMRRLSEIALDRGWARMEWAVLDWNTAAQSFYLDQGAQPLEEWTVWRMESKDLQRLGGIGFEARPRPKER